MALDEGLGGRKRKRSKSLRRADTARDKARIPVQGKARDVMDDVIQHGDKRRTAKQRIDRLGLSDTELRDLSSYSRARSNQSMAEVHNRTWARFDDAIGLATGVKPSDAWWSYTHPKQRLLGEGRAANQTDGAALAFFPFGRAGRAAEKAVEKARPAGADEVLDVLPKAKVKRREQEKLYTAERRERAAKAEAAMEAGGEAGYQAALAQLKGELPKLRLGDDLKDFDQTAVDELFTHIQQNEAFRPYDKVRTQAALRKVLDGEVPQKSEIRMLEKAFGPDLANQVTESVGWWRKAKNMGLSIINIPRSLQASIDLSAPFRQGLVLGARNPALFAKQWKPMLKSFAREGAYDDTMAVIAEMPNFPRMQKAKLSLTDLQGSVASREDYFNSQIAETLTGGKLSPVRMSGRGYTAFLNKFRADAFNHYLRMAEDAGHNIDDERLLRSLAEFINTATGRGGIKKLEGSMNALTAVFFSPRLIASRLQFFNPGRYGVGPSTHPFVAKQNRAAARNLLGGIGLTLVLAEAAGADVIRDPRSADFGKIKVGDTRVDITGGHQGYVVQAARQISGETVSSTTGEVTELEGGFGERSNASVAWDFAKNKLAPTSRYVVGQRENENFAGEPFDELAELKKMFVPIGVGSTVEAYQQGGPSLAALTGGLGGVGFGVLTYGPGEPKGKSKSLRGGGGGDRSKSLRSGRGGRSKSLRSR